MAIGVAIIGSGIFAKEEHLPAVQGCSSLSLKAIYSRSSKSATALSEGLAGVETYADDAGAGKSLADLLKRTDVEAVIIALPIPAQPDYIKQALKAGKHVLAEKPIAKDVATATELIQWYKSNIDTSKVTFGIAENFRYLPRFRYGAQKVQELGKVLGFRQRLSTLVTPGGKYIETSWRKVPEYQGGFLLDGGVHFIAAMRQLLGPDVKMTKLSAFTAQLQPHLPPIDTANASVKLSNGSSGNIMMSFGTTFTGAEWTVACERGTVDVESEKVTVVEGGKQSSKDFPDDGNGVTQEVKAWAESIVNGKPEPDQSPEQALADLETLEAMVKSGEADGRPIDLTLQI